MKPTDKEINYWSALVMIKSTTLFQIYHDNIGAPMKFFLPSFWFNEEENIPLSEYTADFCGIWYAHTDISKRYITVTNKDHKEDVIAKAIIEIERC